MLFIMFDPGRGCVKTKFNLVQVPIQEEIWMRKGAVVALFGLVAGLLVSAVPAIAHHSFAAEFDAAKPVTKQGFVTKVEWTNPHVWFYIDVKNADGTVTNWGFEMGPPHGLQGGGWKRDTMKLGDEVIVAGTLAKNGSNRGNARNVTLAKTGKKMGAASSEGETP
jgi:hypothetical protein